MTFYQHSVAQVRSQQIMSFPRPKLLSRRFVILCITGFWTFILLLLFGSAANMVQGQTTESNYEPELTRGQKAIAGYDNNDTSSYIEELYGLHGQEDDGIVLCLRKSH